MANLSDFDSFLLIGKGSFGKVQKARKINGEDADTVYALKKTRLKYKDCFATEKNILSLINHPFIVKLFSTFENEEYYFMIMEYLCGGTLWKVLQITPILSEEQASFYIKELVLALEYLHSKGIVYRDLKDSNTMLDATGHIKILDFGLSVQLTSENGKSSYDYCGTIDYMAPEILSNTGHGLPVDWWSLGVLVYKMTVGTMPFRKSARSDIKAAILIGEYNLPENLSPDLRDLVSGLLESNVLKRLGYNGAEEVKTHKFFRSTCWEAVLECSEIPPFLPEITDPLDNSMLEPVSDTSLRKSSFSSLSKIPIEDPKSIEKRIPSEKMEEIDWKQDMISDIFLKKKKRKNKKKVIEYNSTELNAEPVVR